MAAASSPTASAQISQNQFLQLMVTQLQNQDPLDPTDNGQMLAQLAQFSTLSGMEQLNASFSDMLSLQELTQGSSLIGKQISYTDTSGNADTGTVSSVGMSSGNLVLQVGSNQVQLSQITGVSGDSGD